MTQKTGNRGSEHVVKMAVELRVLLEELADSLDSLHFKTHVASATGVTVAVVGTVLSITGGLLAVVTAGASLALVLLGGSLAASGGITVSASHLAHSISSKRRLRMAERKWETLKQQLRSHHHSHRTGHRADEETMCAEESEEKEALVEKRGKFLPLIEVDSALLSLSIADLVTRGVARNKESGEPAGSALRELAQTLRVLENKSSFKSDLGERVKKV